VSFDFRHALEVAKRAAASEVGMTVWKFSLGATVLQSVEMPQGAQILHVDAQGDHLCLWALVRPNEEREKRMFRIVGTGYEEITGSSRYIGTALMGGGTYVWHVFEEKVGG
jgi:hypothetical protein